jgi:hypothetical protein
VMQSSASLALMHKEPTETEAQAGAPAEKRINGRTTQQGPGSRHVPDEMA